MHPNKLLRFANIFYSLAAGEELPSDSDDLKIVLSNLEKLETYAARKKYAEANLKHLSSGSSRLTYLTDKETVIKLAKNDRGIAQNKAEVNCSKSNSKYVNKILCYAKNYAWIEVPYLEKITEKDFKRMTDLQFEDFGEAIRFGLKDVSGNSEKKKPKNYEEISKTDIYKEVRDFGERYKTMPGDIARISSWGAKEGNPILIDTGLTKDVFADFYEESSS